MKNEGMTKKRGEGVTVNNKDILFYSMYKSLDGLVSFHNLLHSMATTVIMY